MRRIERDPDIGESCGWRSSTGDLSDCRKLYFDADDDPSKVSLDTRRRSRYYRIVYRVVEDGEVEIIAIGPGHPPPDHDAVYVTAGQRLGRVSVSMTAKDPSSRRRSRRRPRRPFP